MGTALGLGEQEGVRVGATVLELAGPGCVLGHETGGVAGLEDPILGSFGCEPEGAASHRRLLGRLGKEEAVS